MIAYAIYIFAFLNLATFICYGLDKYYAKSHKWRIPEKVLLLLAFFGGSVGALFGMQVFHHKTKKKAFYIGVPAMLLLQLAILCYAAYHWFLAI